MTSYDDTRLRLRIDLDPGELSTALDAVDWATARPAVADDAVNGLKFADVLPRPLAADTVARRLADVPSAQLVAREPLSRVHEVT
ncbi:hypothetical protein [Kineococcus glutinatus]